MFETIRETFSPGEILATGWQRMLAAFLSAGLVIVAAACSGGASPVTSPATGPASAPATGAAGAAPAGAITPAKNLTGAGATFPYPIMG